MNEIKPLLIQPRPAKIDVETWKRVAGDLRSAAVQIGETDTVDYYIEDLDQRQLLFLARLLEEHHGPRYVVNMPEFAMPIWKEIIWAIWGSIMIYSIALDIWGRI